MGIVTERVTAPEVEPVDVGTAKAHMHVTASVEAQDTLIGSLITAARRKAEAELGRALITQTWKLYLDTFPGNLGIIKLPYAPLQSVTHIKYYDEESVQQTMDAEDYQVDTKDEPGRIKPEEDVTWPSVHAWKFNPIEIQYIAGYGDSPDDVPEEIRQAMLLMIAHWFENREDVVLSGSPQQVPKAAEYLLSTCEIPGL